MLVENLLQVYVGKEKELRKFVFLPPSYAGHTVYMCRHGECVVETVAYVSWPCDNAHRKGGGGGPVW